MTGFAGDRCHMLVDVRKPVGMALVGIMAVFAAAHAALGVWCDVELGTLSACNVVIGSLQILVDVQDARIVEQVIGLRLLSFVCVCRIVQGVVTICTLELPFSVDIPGSVQVVLSA